MSEIEKLEKWLKEARIKFTHIYESNLIKLNGGSEIDIGRNQIIVYDEEGTRLWDAICHYGSYGYEQGLLEIMGDIVDVKKEGDTVVGYLTADDVIKRVKGDNVNK